MEDGSLSEVTIIVPAYNEAALLPAFLEKRLPYCQQNEFKLNIVNDDSSERSGKILAILLSTKKLPGISTSSCVKK